MASTTIKVDTAVRDRLAGVARARGTTMGALLQEVSQHLANEQHDRDVLAACERIQHEDPEAWAEYLAELAEIDGMGSDGLGDAREEWPEYNQ